MVATKIWEVSTKATDWYNNSNSGGSTSTTCGANNSDVIPTINAAKQSTPNRTNATTTTTTKITSNSTTTQQPQFLDYANSSFCYVVDSVYDVFSNIASQSWLYMEPSNQKYNTSTTPTTTTLNPFETTSTESNLNDTTDVVGSNLSTKQSTNPWFNSFISLSSDLSWMLTWHNNPYNSIRGRDFECSSMSAVRDLINLVPTHNTSNDNYKQKKSSSKIQHTIRDKEKWWGSILISPGYGTTNLKSVLQPSHQKKSITVKADEEDWTDPPENSMDTKYIFRQESACRRQLQEREVHPDREIRESLTQQQSSLSRHQDDNDNVNNINNNHTSSPQYYSPSETASQLAEGTLRALRDLALDEAVELQSALRFWTERWERPLLSWIEAGPIVWTSRQGYNHQEVGRKVAQIQAVLARRCASIGELQQQLLTAGWAKGVAQWGVLGQGSSQWAPVTGFDNARDLEKDVEPTGIASENPKSPVQGEVCTDQVDDDNAPPLIISTAADKIHSPRLSEVRTDSFSKGIIGSNEQGLQNFEKCDLVGMIDFLPPIAGTSSNLLLSSPVNCGSTSLEQLIESVDPTYSEILEDNGKSTKRQFQAGVFVGRKHGGGIYVDDPGFLALWSVQALSLVRRHLYRAGNGLVVVPCQSNWRAVNSDEEGQVIIEATNSVDLPIWAEHTFSEEGEEVYNASQISKVEQAERSKTQVTITNLPLMVHEIEELLDVMEDIMAIQRSRRLDKLRAPSWFRCNWYIIATVLPSVSLVVYQLGGKGYENTKSIVQQLVDGVKAFFREHVIDPLMGIANELWKGRERFSDQKARTEAIASLKKMLASWLEDTYPEMPESKKFEMAEAMDISLIEQRKEESLKAGILEMHNVVRMSFIEMQYMKKEVMNALHAMDEMKSSNDINMNLAAVTPAVLMASAASSIFRFCVYAILKLGKSREETYASFRLVLTEIERLLVMRDSPPHSYSLNRDDVDRSDLRSVLGSDDLGMLMLLIHECRNIMWKNRSRFAPAIIRSVSEDLAELAGERGAVSVKQQLRIVERMCRSYPFLKVISTGHLFQYSRLRGV